MHLRIQADGQTDKETYGQANEETDKQTYKKADHQTSFLPLAYSQAHVGSDSKSHESADAKAHEGSDAKAHERSHQAILRHLHRATGFAMRILAMRPSGGNLPATHLPSVQSV